MMDDRIDIYISISVPPDPHFAISASSQTVKKSAFRFSYCTNALMFLFYKWFAGFYLYGVSGGEKRDD